MKTFIFLLCCVTVASAQTPSLNPNAGAANVATNPIIQTIVGYQQGTQTANQNVWQKIVQITDAHGNVTYQTNNAYTELATGLNHLVNGQWVTSKEEIDISADGNSASAINGQHQVHFPGDIYSGQIELVTPDGKHLYSRPVGLSYDDGTKTVLIAELTNSTGEILPSGNQVLYANAFTDFGADIRYTYTKAGFEQDIILREQPPAPASFGLNPDTTRLQVLTEFFNPPQPTVTANTVSTDAGNLEDDFLDFGVMQMIPGKAFLLGTTTPTVAVNKQWLTLDGRHILVEEVPVASIADELDNLPLPQATSTQPNAPLNIVSTKRLLPTQRMATIPNKHPMQLAQATPSSHGLVLDYVTMTSQTNYTFRGDTTYYISGTVNLYQTNTFEGGAVLKYTNNASIYLENGNVLNWKAAAYRPVIFTAKDDGSVGDTIIGSTGTPTNYYANPALNFGSGTYSTISYFRIAYAQQAIYAPGVALTLYDAQLVNCQNGIDVLGNNPLLRNILFSNVQTNFNGLAYVTVYAQNVTFNNSAYLMASNAYPFSIVVLNATNCIFANITNRSNGTITLSGGYNGFYNTTEFGTGAITNNFYPFQSVGGGNYYLSNGCAFANAGTTNIDPTLLASLAQKTTWPPIVFSDVTISVNTTLGPQAQRDTDIPDLGYHYDPLDYAFGGVALSSGTTLTLSPGTAIAPLYGSFSTICLDIDSTSGAQFISQGTATSLNRFAEYTAVQESTTSSWRNAGRFIETEDNSSTVNCQFTDFSVMASDSPYCVMISYYPTASVFQNCQFHGGKVYVGTSGSSFINCLFERVLSTTFIDGSVVDTVRNNLFWNNSSMTFTLGCASSLVQDNMFYQSAITDSSSASYIRGYNGYYTTNGTYLHGTNATDKYLTNDVGYETSYFGNYYLPTNSLLINIGNTNANLLGLYHFTTTTNEVKETNSIVDIGYHYVATDTNGIPLDTDGDGIPDYIEDANGNGLVDSGETSWTNYNSINGLAGGSGVLVFTPLK